MGDLILKQFARQLKIMVRRCDTVVRFGGEEFLVICQDTNIIGAKQLAERIRVAVESKKFKSKKLDSTITVSLGAAQISKNMKGPNDLLKAADKALYEAKNSGRNAVCIATSM